MQRSKKGDVSILDKNPDLTEVEVRTALILGRFFSIKSHINCDFKSLQIPQKIRIAETCS